MSKTMAVRFASSAAVMLSALLVACEDGTVAPPTEIPVASVAITPPTPTMVAGDQLTLTAMPKAANGAELDRDVSWSSENTALATVSEAGIVSALAPGDVGIRATSEGIVGRVALHIQPVSVAEVRLSVDAEIVLEWNGSTQISATALDAHGNELLGREVQWLTNRASVATVNGGAITAVGMGTATITALIEGVLAHIGVRVKQAPVTDVFIDAPSNGLEVGEAASFGSRMQLESGEMLIGPLTWTTSAPEVARVTHVDLFYAVIEAYQEGEVTITASKDGKSASLTVRVSPRVTHDLIFNRWNGSASEIFTLGLRNDGLAPVKLNAGNVSRDPSPSPDGTQFVFAVSQLDGMGRPQHDLYIVNRNGLNMRWLTRTAGLEDQPQWSPDGSKILFHGTNENGTQPNLFTVNVDGTGLVNLTGGMPDGVTDKRDPAWSPDGSRIAFIAARDGKHKVWTINADGSDAAQLISDVGFDQTPTWSSDGQKIAFVRYNETAGYGDDVMIVSASGGTPVRLALTGDQRNPAWSPDGNYIAVSGNAQAGRDPQEIWTLRPDGTGLKLRTVNPAFGGGVAPAWIVRQ